VSTASALYVGSIRHRRREPRDEFRHGLALAYLDLDELPSLLGGRLAAPGPGLVRFRRSDYLGDPDRPLADSVRERVRELTGVRPAGPIRILTQLRSFGLCFNPVSFYYCLDPAGQRLQHVLAEVTNTPWGERRSYVMSDIRDDSSVIAGTFAKELHVSPFFGMDHTYRARASTPAQTLSVHIENEQNGAIVFDATLSMRRRPLDRRTLAQVSARFPVATARVLALIYGHALALKLRGARYHPHPAEASR
jgi:uncharacterized protein